MNYVSHETNVLSLTGHCDINLMQNDTKNKYVEAEPYKYRQWADEQAAATGMSGRMLTPPANGAVSTE